MAGLKKGRHTMGKQKMGQNRKERDLYAGFGIDKEDLKRAVANPNVIDTNKRRKFMDEPKLVD